jgi:branched-chain amino acid aminotransferase
LLPLSLETGIDLANSGARHGAGLFETIRVAHGQPLLLEAHLERLARGAAFLGMDAPPSPEEVAAFLESRQTVSHLASGVLRLFALDGRLIVSAAPWERVLPGQVSIGISERFRRHSRDVLNRFKTMAYLPNLLLGREAAGRNLLEVIALNESGRLTDGGRFNVFLVLENRVVTPRAGDGALPGIARGVLLQSGLAEEASLTESDLAQAPAVFLSNALFGVVPVSGVAGGGRKDPTHPRIAEASRLLQATPMG